MSHENASNENASTQHDSTQHDSRLAQAVSGHVLPRRSFLALAGTLAIGTGLGLAGCGGSSSEASTTAAVPRKADR